MADRDVALARIARSQAGVFHRRQAQTLGYSDAEVSRRLRAGAWARSGVPLVYRLASWPPSFEASCWAALLWGGPGAALSHATAAALWGLERYERQGQPHVTVPPGRRGSVPGAITHRRIVGRAASRVIEGLRVTDPERTLLDEAWRRDVRDDVVEDAVESALRLGLTTVERLWAAAASREPGSRRLRRVLERRGGQRRPRGSALEGAFVRLMREAGLPQPVGQFEVRVANERFFVDFAFPALRVAIELDGMAKLRTTDGAAHFLRRQTLLAAAGWRLLRFTWDDVQHRPAWVVACLRAAVAA